MCACSHISFSGLTHPAAAAAAVLAMVTVAAVACAPCFPFTDCMRGKLAWANDDGWMDAYRSGHITAVYAYAQVTGPHSRHALSIIHRALAAWSAGHWVVARGSAEEDGAAQRNTEINDLGSTSRVHLAAVVYGLQY